MRNACTLPFDPPEEGDFSSSPPSSTRGTSLALQIRRKGASAGALSNDLRSLRLQSLVDDYLERSSHPSYSASPFLPYSSYPFNHTPSSEERKSSNIHELQATFQNMGENYGELRKEVMRAIRQGHTHMLSTCANSPSPSNELLHVLLLEHLRKLGFNAGICKSQRDPHKNLHKAHFPAEEYDYMDVVLAVEKGTQCHANERVIIDVRFRSQFEIARPSTAYVDLLKHVPAAYVGTPRVLQKVLRCLSEAMKKSLECQDMSLPPWRRFSYLNSKWLSPHYSRSIFAPPATKLNHTISKPSTKRENFFGNTFKSPSPVPPKRECSHCIGDNNPTCGVTKPPPRVDSKHKTTKRENSHSIINNTPPLFAKSPLPVDDKRVLKSCNSTSHILRNRLNKQSSIQSAEPMKVPWQLPPLSNPPSFLEKPKKLVGALTMALHNASYSSTITGSLSTLEAKL